MPQRQRITAALALLTLVASGSASAQQGPESGSLVIVGGAMRDPAIVDRFLQLAGGPDSAIVVIPTAGGADHYDQSWRGTRPFIEAGASDVTVLHTYDRDEADSEAFVEPLLAARGVWFGGGRQWRLADSYLGTRAGREIRNVLARGGVIGGSSAGATIQGEYLARGDTGGNRVMMGDHEVGFGFVSGVAIDQHLLKRNRHFDLLEIIEAHPELLGIGLDEDTAIVVRGNQFVVIGSSYVAIYDAQREIDSGGSFYFLAPGDRYDLTRREPFRPQTTMQPLDRVVKRDPGQR